MTANFQRNRLTVLAMFAVASGLIGCATLQDKSGVKLTAEVATGPGAPPPSDAKFIVEIHPEKGKPQAVEKPLAGPTHVQVALEQTGAARKFPRMQIELLRPLPSGGWHKMSLEFDRDTKRIPPEFDYAVLPGDRIIVTEDPTNLLDDVMEAALEPLGISSPEKRKKQETAHRYPVRG